MTAHVRARRFLAAFVLVVFAFAATNDAWAYGGLGGRGGWSGTDTDRLKEKHKERVAQEAEKYVEAFQAVKKEEDLVGRRLGEDVQKARSEAQGDEVKAKRGIRLARHKGIKNLLKVDAKYTRLFAGVRKFKADEGDYFTDETKGKIEILLVQVKDQARANRERIADLYVDVGEPIKALKVLEGIYKSLAPNERMAASDLKGRIKALKAQLGIKDDGAGF
jgi:hypothetical protein